MTDEELLSFAENIGKKVISMIHQPEEGNITWFIPKFDFARWETVSESFPHSLFSGHAGIALFLAAMAKIKDRQLFFPYLEHALRNVRSALPLMEKVGGMAGIAGIMYTFAVISRILHQKPYLQEACTLAAQIDRQRIEEDVSYDVVSGSAGLILALLSLHEKTKESSLLEKAKMGGDHLIEKAHKMDGAWGWVVSQGKAPLCGFSHGSAGISYALFKLAKATDDLKYKHAAEMGIRYERKHYCPDTKNWLDLRESSSNNKETYAWCHGAPGIGFSRLIASKLYPNTELRQEAAIGLESTEKHLMSLHHHLCCGNFGKISILWDSGKILKKKRLREAALKSAAFLLNQEKDLGEHPGFMKGLSGIGYSLLRMTAAGKSLPQVMILE